jgi:hypothetical protein
MQLKNTLTRYGALAQLFHWVIVVLIITQFVLALRAEGLSPIKKIGLLATHKSIGITILVLAVLRLAWRLFNLVPRSHRAEQGDIRAAEVLARSHGVHPGCDRGAPPRCRAQASLLRSRRRAAPDVAGARARSTLLNPRYG